MMVVLLVNAFERRRSVQRELVSCLVEVVIHDRTLSLQLLGEDNIKEP